MRNPKNCPIELIINENDDVINLRIGDEVEEDKYYNGFFYKKPYEDIYGIDIQKYTKDLVDYNFNIKSTDNFQIINNFEKDVIYKVYNIDDIELDTDNITIINKNLKFEEWLKYKNNEAYGSSIDYLKIDNKTTIVTRLYDGDIVYPFKYYMKEMYYPEYQPFNIKSDYFLPDSRFPGCEFEQLTTSLSVESDAVVINSISNNGWTFAFFDLNDTSLRMKNMYMKIIVYTNYEGWVLRTRNNSFNQETIPINVGEVTTIERYWNLPHDLLTIFYNELNDWWIVSNFTPIDIYNNLYNMGVGDRGSIRILDLKIEIEESLKYDFEKYALTNDFILNKYINKSDVFTSNTTYREKYQLNKHIKNVPYFLSIDGDGLEQLKVITRESDDIGLLFNATPNQLIDTSNTDKLFNFRNISDKNYSLFEVIVNNDSSQRRLIIFQNCDYNKKDIYQLYWLNRDGGIDSITMNGKNYLSNDIDRKKYQKDTRYFKNNQFNGDLIYDSNPQYLNEYHKKYRLNSEIIGEEYKYLEDLFNSDKVWLYSLKDDEYRMVNVITNNYDFNNYNSASEPFNLFIELEDKYKNTFI